MSEQSEKNVSNPVVSDTSPKSSKDLNPQDASRNVQINVWVYIIVSIFILYLF